MHILLTTLLLNVLTFWRDVRNVQWSVSHVNYCVLWSISSTFINNAHIFRTKVLSAAFFYLHVTREKLPKWLSYKKGALKTLMKLTPAKSIFHPLWGKNQFSLETYFFTEIILHNYTCHKLGEWHTLTILWNEWFVFMLFVDTKLRSSHCYSDSGHLAVVNFINVSRTHFL